MAIKLNWLITGPGAISGLIAAGLLQHQQQVAWLRRSHSDTEEMTWSLDDNAEPVTYRTPVFVPGTQPDAVVLAVKSYDMQTALQRLDQLAITKDCPIIISHNGLVSLDSQRPLFPLITTHAASRTENKVTRNGSGESWLAEIAVNCPIAMPNALAAILAESFPPLHLSADIEQRRWRKLLINCVINPLTAIHQVTNGELAAERFASTKRLLIKEFILVAQACGYSFQWDEALASVNQVITATANNRSSMLVDIDNHRRTEIGAMNGYIVEKAREHGIDVPTHQAVTKAVTALS